MKLQQGLLIAAVLGAVGFATTASTQTPAPAAPAPAADAPPAAPAMTPGQYNAILGDCEACHTRPGGAPFSGGVALNTPFGTIYSANITPDKDHGIGAWTQDQFRRAMKHGKDDKGRNLYPAFSYPYYSHVRQADVDSVFDYLKTVPAAAYTPPKNKMGFPFNVRFLVTFWNWLYLKPAEFQDDPKQTAEWNRGAYLVNGLGHCGACHTPKSLIGGDEYSKALQGGKLDNWLASDLTNAKRHGVGGWEKQDIVDFLKTGINGKTSAYGSMTEVVRFSTSKMNDADLNAIAAYLKSVPASAEVAAPKPDAAVMAAGKAVYDKSCATCHQADGAGIPMTYPGLAANANIQAGFAGGLTHVVLTGSKTGNLKPFTDDPMPGFAAKLNDAQIANVLTYVRNAWGNSAPAVDVKSVAKLRKLTAEEAKTPAAP
jgi:mono/diheme cytochrome c family protein